MSNQFGDTRIDDDLTLLSETLEEVLRSSGDPADQKYVELKARAEKALDDGTPLKPPYTGVLHFFCSTPYNVRLLTGRGPRAITYYGAGKSTAPFVARDSGDTRHSGYRYSFPSQRRF